MTSKLQTLYLLMQQNGYSHATCVAALHLVQSSVPVQDELIYRLSTKRFTEKRFISMAAEVAAQHGVNCANISNFVPQN